MGTYNRNLETGKLEMHFDKSEYMSLSDDQKREIKRNFLFSRNSSAWVSRCKFPNLYHAEKVAEKLGLTNEGNTGEKLSFEEQQERKAERAERRADRYDYKSDRAAAEGARLQAPINGMHGDIAFFTQPNINTSAGRAFTRRRDRMWASFEKGIESFRKSDYYAQRAETARQTAANTKTQDKGFCQRRIDEASASIRKLTKSIDEYNGYIEQINAGQKPVNKYGWEVNLTIESITSNIERWEEIREDELSKLAYYDALINQAGGVVYSKENIKPGYIVKLGKSWRGCVEVVSTGTKNITYMTESGFTLKASYAEITEVVKADAEQIKIPFNVGEEYTLSTWGLYKSEEPIIYKVIKVNGYKVTLKHGDDRAICKQVRRGAGASADSWFIDLKGGYICKKAE